VSQFLLQPTALGSLPIIQKYITSKAGEDFMTGPAEYLNVRNGILTGKILTPGAALYLHNGRGLAAYTHDDVLYQAYLIAYLVLSTISNGTPAPLNPGNPYIGSKTQNGFGTFGQPDIAATLVAVAGEAIRGSLVPEMVGTPAPPAGIRRRDRLPAENRAGRDHRGPRERYGSQFAGGAGQLQGEQ
jgi:hypothetical protein